MFFFLFLPAAAKPSTPLKIKEKCENWETAPLGFEMMDVDDDDENEENARMEYLKWMSETDLKYICQGFTSKNMRILDKEGGEEL